MPNNPPNPSAPLFQVNEETPDAFVMTTADGRRLVAAKGLLAPGQAENFRSMIKPKLDPAMAPQPPGSMAQLRQMGNQLAPSLFDPPEQAPAPFNAPVAAPMSLAPVAKPAPAPGQAAPLGPGDFRTPTAPAGPGAPSGPLGAALSTATAAAPLRPQGPDQEALGYRKAFEGERAANAAAAGAATGRSEETARLQEQQLKDTAAFQARKAEDLGNYQRAYDGQMKKVQQAVSDYGSLNTSVDANHLWASRTMGQKMLAGIGLLLGGVGQGFTHNTENKSLEIINQAITRDIEAQKATMAAGLQKGGERIQAEQSLLGQMRQRFGDDVQASDAAHLVGLEQFRTQIALATEKAAPGEIKAKLMALDAGVAKEQADLFGRMKQRGHENALKERELGLREREVSAKEYGEMTDRIKAEKAATAKQKIPAATATNMADFETAAKAVDELYLDWKKSTGKLSGVAQYLPSSDAKQYTNHMKSTSQVVAHALEEGKVSDPDVPRYEGMQPQPGDSEETALKKVENLKRLLREKAGGHRAGLERAGFDTSGYGAGPRFTPDR